MIQTSLFSISVFLAGVLSFFSPCILPLMPVYVGILLDSERVKTVRIFGRDISWYGSGEDALFYRRSINCFPDSRIWCRGPWPGALCSMVSLSARRDCDLIRDSPNGRNQSKTTPKAKDHPTQKESRNAMNSSMLF